MSEIHVVAIITPTKGKESDVREHLIKLGANVEKHETDVVNGEGTNVFVVEEICGLRIEKVSNEDNVDDEIDKTQNALDAHFKTAYFQALGKTIEAEGLLAAPLDIKTIKPIGGFASR